MLILSLRDEKGLGVWLLPKEKAIPKARRSSGSRRKSSLPQRLPASPERESVADCIDQTLLKESVSGNDPAMVKTVEDPSAVVGSGTQDIMMQRKEVRSRPRNRVSRKSGKAHVAESGRDQIQAGDSSREKDGTQKFLAVGSLITRNRPSKRLRR
ncbi:MAG: hypothetical protein ACXADS_01680 [Candidatus Thorarchaeota archaeon]|jgi:hypothetical protein